MVVVSSARRFSDLWDSGDCRADLHLLAHPERMFAVYRVDYYEYGLSFASARPRELAAARPWSDRVESRVMAGRPIADVH